jgi:hypothetical protein
MPILGPKHLLAPAQQPKAAPAMVSWFRLLNCDGLDYAAMFLGLAGSLVNAPIMPLFAVVFGDVRFFPLTSSFCSDSPRE